MAWLPFVRRSGVRRPPPRPRPAKRRKQAFGPATRVMSLAQTAAFRQGEASLSPAVYPLVPRAHPLSFARAPSGDLYMASGLVPMLKWDGVRYAARTVGVAPPAAAPTVAGAGGPGGALSGTYTAYQRYLDEDGNPSNLSPVSNQIVLSGAGSVAYSNVAAPADPKIARRQLLRNTSGQATTYYVDVDTADLSATAFASTRTDSQLGTQEAVPLFDTAGDSLADRYTVPPSDKPFVAAYLDRVFAAGEVSYTEGGAIVTNGSAAVTGVGTQWTASLAGRFLYVTGVNLPAQIASADPVAQTLTLAAAWQGPSDNFASYAIRPPPAERNVIYFSEAGLPEAWPATNGVTIEQNGDVVTGLLSAESFLYVLQRKHVYRMTYHLGPLVDGGVFLAALRGCVNDRSWAYLDGFVYMLDEQGVYRMGGGGTPEPLSAAIQDLFFVDRAGGGLRINWAAQKWFHALHCKDERTIRWFVALSGARLPRHALCYNYDSRAWWVEEFAFPVGASCLTDGPSGLPFLAGPSRRVFQQGVGSLDGPDPLAGTTRAAATAGGAESLTGPSGVTYPASGIVGSPVGIYDGRGKGGRNLAASVAGGVVRCVRPWAVRPDATSKFQLGGFPWVWDSGDFRWLNEEGDEQRRVEVVFPPTPTPAQCDLRYYLNFSATPDVYGADWPASAADADALRSQAGSGDAVIDLSFRYGMAAQRRPGRRELYVRNADVFGLELAGFSAESLISIYEVNVDGAGQ